MNIISEFHGENSIRQSLIFKSQNKYHVRQLENGDVRLTQVFENLEEAENFAEDWVMGENNE